MAACKSCGKASVEIIDHNGEEQCVCTSCGVVQEKGICFFSTEEGSGSYVSKGTHFFENQSIPRTLQSETKPPNSRGRKQGFYKISVLSSCFRLPPHLKSQAFDLYARALLKKTFYMWRIEKKTILAGCCVYVLMRQNNWPVTVSNMCNALSCCKTDFSQPYFKLVSEFQLSIPTLPVEDLVDSYINNCKKIQDSEKDLLKARLYQVLQIAKDCSFTSGRTQRPLLLACIYITWQSLDGKRYKTSFQKFLSDMGFVQQKQAAQVKIKFFKNLCLLGNKIPWFEPNFITPSNVCKYLEEILKYSSALLFDIRNTTVESEKEVTKIDQVEPRFEESDISDSEIESYIRTKSEVEFIQNMNKCFS